MPKNRVIALFAPVLIGPALLSSAVLATAPGALSAQEAPPVVPGHPGVLYRTVEPAWLGVSYDVRWVQRDGQCDPQVLIESVVQGSPADRAGLRSGDAIVALNGQPVPAARLSAISNRLTPGDSIRLKVDREGRIREVLAVAGRRPARPPMATLAPSRSGLTSSSAPIIHMDGEVLVARNVGTRQNATGYWFATGDGEAEYRRLGSWSQDDVDARVVRLLRCAEEVEWQPVPTRRIDLQQVQRRADSLRVVIATRALQHEDILVTPGDVGPSVHLGDPGTSYTLRAFRASEASDSRGLAGAEVTVLGPELAEYFRNAREGLLVLRIDSDTPAERAGLRPGDVIVEGNGRKIGSVGDFRLLLSFPDPDPVQLRVVRKGRIRTITLPRR